ncbi:hypothetical protein CH54_1919 [Yersinia rochesterensis]|uniref:Uncharacterized protein n=2 Tax=Yersinia TaxID=629 RepID=A0ABM5SKT5_9GAMM|nr:hypothetical protein DJ57_2841 [Yersinia rochesterensis]AJI88935.1 hypothetical protein AW19_3871 [Yersinia frederiksenii Y225]AJJ35058.1 hypothetical protein CH54_1919 [Yersinia rochesterensis]CNI09432.1 hemagglutinin/adhesin repeat-containing protein [Yersinia kristensenii]CNI41749.1 hemagglutinin/adhesin repeat-containing protein [Yersinia thracica]
MENNNFNFGKGISQALLGAFMFQNGASPDEIIVILVNNA